MGLYRFATLSFIAIPLSTLLLAGSCHATFAANDVVEVTIDEAKLLRLDRPAAEIVVGNPSIADVAVQSGKLLVVTGKSFGSTNLIVLDADGKEVLQKNLSVEEPSTGLVTLHDGAGARVTFYCAPRCTSPMAIGDDKEHFDTVAKQIQTKQSMGQSSAEGSKPTD